MGAKKVLKLSAWLSRRLQNGNWAKLKSMRSIHANTTPAQDVDILNLIEGMAARTYSYHSATSQCVLAGRETPEAAEEELTAWMQRRMTALQRANRRYWRDIIAELKQFRAAGKLMPEGAEV